MKFLKKKGGNSSYMYLRSVYLLDQCIPSDNKFPFSIPTIKKLKELNFKSNVTFFVGENGSGKSTLLEAIADKCGFNTAGGGRNNLYEVDSAESALGEYIRLSWSYKMTNGFFLRAETFYNFASYLDSIGDYSSYGNRSLHKQSHGEAFFSLFKNRFGKRSIYLLDEPEAALSPFRQIAFLNIIKELESNSQFIVATHSPIILGYPNAQILNFDEAPISEVKYEETTHYLLTKRFLDNKNMFIE